MYNRFPASNVAILNDGLNKSISSLPSYWRSPL
jgi:hypothetical protein